MAIYCKNKECEASTMDRSEEEYICDDCFDRAVKILEAMDDTQFNQFLDRCPARVKLLVRGRTVDWKHTLPPWYITLVGSLKANKHLDHCTPDEPCSDCEKNVNVE